MAAAEIITPRLAEQIILDLVPADQWSVYAKVWNEAKKRHVPIAMGGGLALSAYSGYVRNTKDMDLFVTIADHGRLLDIMRDTGFTEYTEYPYDPTWSFRGYNSGFVVDVLWKMLNGRADVEERWVTGGWNLKIRGVEIRLLTPEDLLWSKLYILRRDRCDWPDILNLIYTQGPHMDWTYLLSSLEEDRTVMAGVMNLFKWMCPGRATVLPQGIWERLEMSPPAELGEDVDRSRTALFEAGEWFTIGGC